MGSHTVHKKKKEREKVPQTAKQASENHKRRRKGEAKEMSKSILEFREDIAN